MHRFFQAIILCAALLVPGFVYAWQLASTSGDSGAQCRVYKYRVYFKDKKNSPYKKSKPSEFLSKKALLRRAKWHIKIDSHDLPVSPQYVSEIATRGVKVLCVSKWNNTALVQHEDSGALNALATLPFVDKVKKVYHDIDFSIIDNDSTRFEELNFNDSIKSLETEYGYAQSQIEMLNGIKLHELGFRGRGMTIAVIDGGFRNADRLRRLDNVAILGTHNFVRPRRSVYAEGQHGTNVLSCMGANKPHLIVGTAPDAKYWLLVSEDSYTETPAEEDTWAAALEFADSVGADVVNSSLGYNLFNDSTMNVKYSELDGMTHLISRSASLAASRGVLVVNSAGNSGDEDWQKIGIPADARNILTVGAAFEKLSFAQFTSRGFTADGRVKPDVSARGRLAAVVRSNGAISPASGTSFSSPITAGMTVCLMQALPKLKPEEIIDLLHQCGNRSWMPDNILGYGVPDYYKAYKKGKP